VAAFMAELLGGSGEVLIGRNLPERTLTHATTFPVSRLNHVYLNDHTMAGQRVVPLRGGAGPRGGGGARRREDSDGGFGAFHGQ
jgi:hypothetical protein